MEKMLHGWIYPNIKAEVTVKNVIIEQIQCQTGTKIINIGKNLNQNQNFSRKS